MIAILRNKAVVEVSLGHAAVDVLNGALPVLLAAMAMQMGLSNVALGTVSTIYFLTASLTQPLFGWMADRWDSRWVGVGGMLWLAGGYALAAMLPGRLAFAAFIVAALGSGAYHPQGTLTARRAAGAHAASGTSLFFFFGQSGQAIGPALSGLLLARLSFGSTVLLLAGLTLPVALLLARGAARRPDPAPVLHGSDAAGHRMAWTPLAIGAFVMVLLFRGWPPAATTTFLPKWLADEGFTSSEFGLLLAIFMFCTALGNIVGGWLADRWSHKGVVVLSLALAPFPFMVLYQTPSVGVAAALATAVAGLFMGMPHSVMMLMGQNLLPGRMGFASGLVMGFMFSVGAVAGWVTGWLGDLIGLQQALNWAPALCLAGALCAIALPRARPRLARIVLPAPGD